MTTTARQPAAPKCKLRWYQFSLRTLLLLLLAVSAGMSWLAVKMQRAKQEEEAVAVIEKLGGTILYDYEAATPPRLEPPGPRWLRSILGEHLFTRVDQVLLGTTQVTDSELAELQVLRQLKELYLTATGVTDAGMENLQTMQQLQVLAIDGTQTTDAGLVYLQKLTQLRELFLDDTKVTPEGVKELQQALPNCQIEWTPPGTETASHEPRPRSRGANAGAAVTKGDPESTVEGGPDSHNTSPQANSQDTPADAAAVLRLVEENRLLKEQSLQYLTQYLELRERELKRIHVRAELVPMRLLGLLPEIKARMHLHLLDFTAPPPFAAQTMALADLKAGHRNILTGGLNLYTQRVQDFLQSKYRIQVVSIADCCDGAAIFQFIDDYNKPVKAAIEKDAGKSYEKILVEAGALKEESLKER